MLIGFLLADVFFFFNQKPAYEMRISDWSSDVCSSDRWRFKLLAGEIAWDDLVRGPVAFQGENLSDPVLLREDGRPLYTLTSVVDDIELGITHVIRGEDHVANTDVQVQLFEELAGKIGRAHV